MLLLLLFYVISKIKICVDVFAKYMEVLLEISFQNMNVLLLAFSIMALLLKLLRFSRLMRALLPGLMILLVGTLYYYELELCHNFLVG